MTSDERPIEIEWHDPAPRDPRFDPFNDTGLRPYVELAERAVRATAEPVADRGRDTGIALSEVRTVLGRARTALGVLEYDERGTEWDTTRDERGFLVSERKYKDPDHDAMVAALRQTVAALERWERTGRPLKGKR